VRAFSQLLCKAMKSCACFIIFVSDFVVVFFVFVIFIQASPISRLELLPRNKLLSKIKIHEKKFFQICRLLTLADLDSILLFSF